MGVGSAVIDIVRDCGEVQRRGGVCFGVLMKLIFFTVIKANMYVITGTQRMTTLHRMRVRGRGRTRRGGGTRRRTGGTRRTTGTRESGSVSLRPKITIKAVSPRSSRGIICLAFSSKPSTGARHILSVLSRCSTGTAFFVATRRPSCFPVVGGICSRKRAIKLRDCARRCSRICTSISTCFSSLRGVKRITGRRLKFIPYFVHFPKNTSGSVSGGCSTKVVARLARRILSGKCRCCS